MPGRSTKELFGDFRLSRYGPQGAGIDFRLRRFTRHRPALAKLWALLSGLGRAVR